MRVLWWTALLVSAASAMSLRACEQRRCDAEEIAPRCASDGLTYANECAFQVAHCENAALRVVAAGVCAHDKDKKTVMLEEQCEEPCTREYIPLCGSDGVTYANKCTFRNARRCKYGGKLWVTKHDAC